MKKAQCRVSVNWEKLAVDSERYMARYLMSKRQMALLIGVNPTLFWRFLEGKTLLSADALFSLCEVIGAEVGSYKLKETNIQLELIG